MAATLADVRERGRQARMRTAAKEPDILRKRPRDGDGDGFYSPFKGAPDRTPNTPQMRREAGLPSGGTGRRHPAKPLSEQAPPYKQGEMPKFRDADAIHEAARREMHEGNEARARQLFSYEQAVRQREGGKSAPAKAAPTKRRTLRDIQGVERKTLGEDIAKRHTLGHESVESIAANNADGLNATEVRALLRENGVTPRKAAPGKRTTPTVEGRKLSDMSPEQAAAAARRGDVDKADAAKHIRAQAAEHDRAAEQLRHPDTHEPDKVTGRQKSIPSTEADRQDAAARHEVEARRLRAMADRISPAPKKAPTKKATSRRAGITPHEFETRHLEGTRAGLSDAEAAKYARSDFDTPKAWREAHPAPAKKTAPAKKAAPRIAAVNDPPTPLDKAIRRRYEAGESASEIGEHEGISATLAHTSLTRQGVQLRPRGGVKKAAPAKKATPRPAKAATPRAATKTESRADIVREFGDDPRVAEAVLDARNSPDDLRRMADQYDRQARLGEAATYKGAEEDAARARQRAVRLRQAADRIENGPAAPATPRKATGATKPPTPRQRALTAGLSPTDATAYAKWEKEHPGESVSAWQAQRRERTAAPKVVVEPPLREPGYNPPELARRDVLAAANPLLRDETLTEADIAAAFPAWRLPELRRLARNLIGGPNASVAQMDRPAVLAFIAHAIKVEHGRSPFAIR